MRDTKFLSESLPPMEMTLCSGSDEFRKGGVELAQIGRLASGAGILWRHHALCEVVFLFCREGELAACLADGEIRLSGGEFLVLFPSKDLTVKALAERNRAEFLIFRGERAVRSILGLGFWDLFKAGDGGRDAMLDSIARSFEAAADHGRDSQVLAMAEFYLENLWSWIRGTSGNADFYDAVRVLNRLSPERMTTEAAAAALGISRSKLNSLFLAILKIRPGEYLVRVKTAIVIAHLLGTSLTIGKIAERMGFSSTSALACFFRKRMGTSPATFRRLPNLNVRPV